jgi:uncharacterized membrane protein YdjX (TVP38/TMEM64 family)
MAGSAAVATAIPAVHIVPPAARLIRVGYENMFDPAQPAAAMSEKPDAAGVAQPTAAAPIDPAAPSAEGCFKRWAKHLGPAGPLAAVMIVLPIVGGAVLLGFIRQLAPWLKHQASGGTALLTALCIAMLAGLSLVPTYVLEIVAGWALGATWGLLAAVAGLTGAALLSFGLSKAVVHEYVLHELHDNARCEAVRHAMVGSGPLRAAVIVALVRLAPIVPFGATNLLMASAGCPVGAFAVGTAVGTVPRTAAVVLTAAGMAKLDFTDRPGLFVGSLLATVVVVGVLGYLAKRALAHVTDVPVSRPV